MDVYGKALLDYSLGETGKELVSHSSLGESEAVPPAYFFRGFRDMPKLEQRALELARGSVLDIGCGAGSHSLYLQGKGLEVTALDSSPDAIRVATDRGVSRAVCADIADFRVGEFQTLLLLMNGIGLAGTRANLAPFLMHLKGLLAGDGQILLDSSDIIYMFDADSDGGVWVPGDREYYGEVTYWWEYGGKRSKPFPWLFADFDTLGEYASIAGLRAELLRRGPHYDYLARLTPAR